MGHFADRLFIAVTHAVVVAIWVEFRSVPMEMSKIC